MKKLSTNELWELMRKQWNDWQKNAHSDDCMSLMDYADEHVGTTFHGATVHNERGDIIFKY
jgi:hypothetical protein